MQAGCITVYQLQQDLRSSFVGVPSHLWWVWLILVPRCNLYSGAGSLTFSVLLKYCALFRVLPLSYQVVMRKSIPYSYLSSHFRPLYVFARGYFFLWWAVRSVYVPKAQRFVWKKVALYSKFYPLLSSDGVGMRNSTYTHSPECTSVNSLAESWSSTVWRMPVSEAILWGFNALFILH